jgi:DNA (cytosine-5)-methyltransferase 1
VVVAVSRPRLLDLFCGAGGAAMGYHRAGFDVVGVDIKQQPRYPFPFTRADAMSYPLSGFDVVHASPPCQRFTAMRTMPTAGDHVDLLTPTRERLRAAGVPVYVIENVPGAPLRDYVELCGSMFLLGAAGGELRRHRWFEIWPSLADLRPPHVHGWAPVTIANYGDSSGISRARRLTRRPRTVGVWGNAGGRSNRDDVHQFTTAERGAAMGIDWMVGAELSQAIPPAYTEWIGRALLGRGLMQ